jgi:hypothetical protein
MKTRMTWIAAVGLLIGAVHALPANAARQPSTPGRAATLRVFAGTWGGHGRSLRITPAGRATESISDGCCDHLITFTYRLSRPRGRASRASATARVTSVHIADPSAFGASFPAPKVGQTGVVRLRSGVISEPFIDTTFCDKAAGLKGRCGA